MASANITYMNKLIDFTKNTPLESHIYKNFEASDINHMAIRNLGVACSLYEGLKKVKDSKFFEKLILDEQDCPSHAEGLAAETQPLQHADL